MLASLIRSLVSRPSRVRRAQAAFEAGVEAQRANGLEAARTHFERALTLDPAHAGAHRALGLLLARQGEGRAACGHLEQALTHDSDDADTWVELGDVYAAGGNLARASHCYHEALRAAPDNTAARLKLASLLRHVGRIDEAIQQLRRAYEAAPDAPEVLRELVHTLVARDLCRQALAVASRALARNPASYEANLLTAFAHHKLHQPGPALAALDRAQALRGDDPMLYDLRGSALQELGRVREALESYDRAIALNPGHALAAFHRALLRLMLGEFAEGWPDYELRLKSSDMAARPRLAQRWDGSPLAGRRLLIYREQGLGDEIMFASLYPELLAAGADCLIECDPRLRKLFQRSFPRSTVFGSLPDRGLPAKLSGTSIDVEIPAGSIPLYRRRRAADFPRHDGYLRAAPERIAYWKERLAALGAARKIGLSWTGGVRQTRQPVRSIPLERLMPLFRTPDLVVVSLQYTAEAPAELAELEARHGIRIAHFPEAIYDYDETAALVCALERVVSVCTSVVHLAGALGRAAWVMAPHSPEWRYGFSGEGMPWYPAVRVFRQPEPGDWDTVIGAVARELSATV